MCDSAVVQKNQRIRCISPLRGSSTETLGWHVGRHAHSLPAVVVLLGPGWRRTVSQQLLFGLLQQCTVGVVFPEQLNARSCVSDWIMLVRDKSCKT